MIRFGKNVRQPTGYQPAEAQALPVTVNVKAFIQQRRNSHSFLVRHQQGRVIYSFRHYGKFLSHTGSLPQFPKPV
jgi:hypothetical protein